MTRYACYVESGPKRRKTMVHVPELLGCVAVGPTTDEALAAAPDAIRAFRTFLEARGEPVEGAALRPGDSDLIEIEVAEHLTEGEWLGNGSPYVVFASDFWALDEAEIALLLHRFRTISGALADWADAQGASALDAVPAAGGRSARAILLHVIAPIGGYLSAALDGATGFSALAGAAERGSAPIGEALRGTSRLADERLAQVTPGQWNAVRIRDTSRGPERRTLRKALRRMLEHDWEHLAELSRRPGGPAL